MPPFSRTFLYFDYIFGIFWEKKKITLLLINRDEEKKKKRWNYRTREMKPK